MFKTIFNAVIIAIVASSLVLAAGCGSCKKGSCNRGGCEKTTATK